jgi:hypothetical protein
MANTLQTVAKGRVRCCKAMRGCDRRRDREPAPGFSEHGAIGSRLDDPDAVSNRTIRRLESEGEGMGR